MGELFTVFRYSWMFIQSQVVQSEFRASAVLVCQLEQSGIELFVYVMTYSNLGVRNLKPSSNLRSVCLAP